MRTALLTLLVCLYASSAWGQQKNEIGILPVGRDGKPLNLDFETGTLDDWTPEGEAFKNQPIKGDTVFPRSADMKSQHQGQYWIGGYERHGDKPQGTLTSVPFKVTHPWASFLVAGGPHLSTCAELYRNDTGELILRASGVEEENLRRVIVDLKPHLGKEIFVRLVDRHSGHWGHVNFDDFRFHAQKPSFPSRPSSPAQADVYKFAGLPPQKAAEVMTVPEGFEVKLFAGEPDVQQPIAMCIDDRGRLWVAEAYSYPIRRPDKEAKDRILIFEDTDGDGRFDRRSVFMEGLNLVSGIEVGFGGVWIGAAPYLMYVPMKEVERSGDRSTTVPAGPSKILLDGWGYQDTHETLNSFIWGPDGWLYGCHGVFTHSRVGKPGTPDKGRVPINAGVWRYHPTKHVFEVFAHGTSNPWGLDFNDQGQAFVEACVIPHCFHIVQGGRYHRQAGPHFNPYTYDDIKTIADHFHYVGPNPHGGNNRSDSAGGGHAHCGLMCYLGGAWPKEYRNQLFMGNIHGRRLNMDVARAKGSGYLAGHGPDFLHANDAWARFINMQYGPDGNVYLIDWYDKQACHHGDPKIWDRSNGRIYKVCYRGTKPAEVDLAKKTDLELIELQLHENDWYVRHARRLLQERRPRRPEARQALAEIARENKDPTRRLRALWALHVTGGLEFKDIEHGLGDADEFVRAWTIQLAVEKEGAEVLRADKLADLAATDKSPVVRRYLASALQRLTFDVRERVLEQLLTWEEDAADPNLPLLYWYALEPLAQVKEHRARAFAMAQASGMPILLPYIVRRIAADTAVEASDDPLEPLQFLVAALAKSHHEPAQLAILRAMNEGLKGRRKLFMPRQWEATYQKLSASPDSEVRNQAAALAATLGDPRAFEKLRHLLADAAENINVRRSALETLIIARDPQLPRHLEALLLQASPLRAQALRGLAAFDHERTPRLILDVYPGLSAEEKRDALNTLASRGSYGKALLDAVAAKQITATDISADIIRQLRNLNDAALAKRINEVWGIVRDTPADRKKLIAQYTKMLKTPAPHLVDLAMGRAVFAKTCQQCHTLYGVGRKVGPDITGSNRANLDYLLENIIDPSAVIQKEYTATIMELKDGRVLTGIVSGETPAALTLLTANETLTIARDDVEILKPTPTSMMPDDVVKTVKDAEFRALIAYLQHPTQTPILATTENVKDFFNGKDLTGWDGDPKLWRVEEGEIVGKSPGLKRNEFLRSHMLAGDFKLSVQVKLTPNKENSGIQFRSEVLPNGDVKGYQADIGAGWWGKLYEEHGRGLLWSKSGETFVKMDGWNRYEIEANGSKIRTWINGQLCVDLDDPSGARRGIFALQLHSGGPLEVRFKDLRLELQ
jgi:putative membrane-bound dehydrogenase-like protein